jgi:hypothetical protein
MGSLVCREFVLRAPDTNLCAFHARRVTIMPKDMQVRKRHTARPLAGATQHCAAWLTSIPLSVLTTCSCAAVRLASSAPGCVRVLSWRAASAASALDASHLVAFQHQRPAPGPPSALRYSAPSASSSPWPVLLAAAAVSSPSSRPPPAIHPPRCAPPRRLSCACLRCRSW